MWSVWHVMRIELVLLWRGRGLPIAALAVALVGLWEASRIREMPWAAWSTLPEAAGFLSLVLVVTSGNQISRDHTTRLDGVVLSTPVSTASYVCGKYLAALLVLVGLATANLVAAVLMDRFDPWRDPPAILGHLDFPPLGPSPYVGAMILLMIVPIVFGAALALTVTTAAHGARTVASIAALVLWLVPAVVNNWPPLLEVTGGRFYTSADDGSPFKLAMTTYSFGANGISWSPAAAARVIGAVQTHLPPSLPPIFVWNRALFIGLGIALLAATVGVVMRQRQGRM